LPFKRNLQRYTVVFLFLMNKYPEWYSRHRETLVMWNRFIQFNVSLTSVYTKAFSPFLRNTQYITQNLFTAVGAVHVDFP
jgi:hypothetical protein